MAKNNQALTEDDDLPQDEYVVVEEPIEEPEEPVKAEGDDEPEEPAAKQQADDDHDEGDTDEERAAIRERRRLEKKERKERQQKAISRDKLELDFLRKRNDDLERRLNGLETRAHQSTLSDYDRQIQVYRQEVETAERIIAKAVEAGNGEDVAKAMRYRDEAVAKANELAYYKQQQAQVPQQQQAPKLDERIEYYAKEFMEANDWYNPQGSDEDSAIVMAIDTRLMQEGYDPRSPEYWDELQDRVERRLPEKFQRQNKTQTPRKPTGGPAVGSGREYAPTSTRKEIYISPERKAALIEAGVWDDPVLRQKYIKQYAQYDQQNKA